MNINAMPEATVAELLQQLRDVAAPLSETDYYHRAIAWAWTTLDSSTKAIVAEGTWPTGGRIHVQLDDGEVRSIRVGLSNSTDRSEQASHDTAAYYQHTVEQAAGMLGPADGEIGGDKPRTWWTLGPATLHISRWGYAVVLTWMTLDEHADMLESIGAQP